MTSHRYKPIIYEILADITDPQNRLSASAAIKRLEKVERIGKCSTSKLATDTQRVYMDAILKLKKPVTRNTKVLEAAAKVKARRERAVEWIENQIRSTH